MAEEAEAVTEIVGAPALFAEFVEVELVFSELLCDIEDDDDDVLLAKLEELLLVELLAAAAAAAAAAAFKDLAVAKDCAARA